MLLLLLAWAQDPAPVDFVREVLPLLRQHCVRCHGAEEPEAELRLDRRASVFAPRDGYALVAPGDPERSELWRRLTLPKDDDELMPSEGQPLPAAELSVLRRWIEQGAAWPAALDAELDAAEQRLAQDRYAIPLPGPAQREVAAAAIERLREAGAHAAQVARDHPAVEVSFRLRRSATTDDQLALLHGLEPVLVHLDLARSEVTAAGIGALAAFTHLRELSLAGTAIGDDAVPALQSLAELRVLNLHGTRMTDHGLARLAALPGLARVYAADSGVTAAGVAELRVARPGLRVQFGLRAAPDSGRGPVPAVNVACPISGKPVDPGVTATHAGQTFAFCCGQCRTKFLAEPERYVPGQRR